MVVLAIVAGAVAGGAIGIALSGSDTADDAGSSQVSSTAVAPAAPSGPERGAEVIYRSASPGVVVITDTQTQSRSGDAVHAARRAAGGRARVRVRGRPEGRHPHERPRRRERDQRAHRLRRRRDVRRAHRRHRSLERSRSRSRGGPAGLLHPLTFGDSSRVQVGESAYAIGNPFGLERTMTAGIISATGRTIQAPNGLTIPDVVQTDAPINHGNSGGPLLDGLGRVIGVNAQIEGGTVDANVGIGFAVPSNAARSVADQLIATGKVRHPWLGVQIETIDPQVAKVVRGLSPKGVTVVAVTAGSPAVQAGLVAFRRQVTVEGASVLVGGDSITKVAGTPVTSSAELAGVIAKHESGDTVTLEVVRDGKTRTVEVTLGNVQG
jgi:hypothetical protein